MLRSVSHSALAAFALALLAFPTLAQTTTRVSVSSLGVQANGHCDRPSISSNGQSVVFESSATNLVAGDTNGATDIFLHDRVAGTTVRVSVDSSGTQATGSSSQPAISGNGRFVAFVSSAANLVPADTNGLPDVFVRDTQAGTTVRASASGAGVQANGPSRSPSLSRDGRFLAFESDATSLVAGDTNGVSDIFLRDLVTGVVSRVSVDSFGNQGNSLSYDPRLSVNGDHVAFTSTATNLVTPDSNGAHDVFQHDRINGTTLRISTSTGGGYGSSDSYAGRSSETGQFVAFYSYASNLVLNDTNSVFDVFLRNTTTAQTTRISVSHAGAQADNGSFAPLISENGGVVVWQSYASNILPPNLSPDWYWVNRTTGAMIRVGTGTGGTASTSTASSMSLNSTGNILAFSSAGTNLVPLDTNDVQDIFVSDIDDIAAGYCFGDGTATACPCGNSSPIGSASGCMNSLGSAGRLDATGMPSIANDTLALLGSGMSNGPCLYFQGTGPFAAGLGTVLGDGLRCAAGTLIRLDIVANVGGASQYPQAGDPIVSVKGVCTPGSVRTYQVWYRDAQTFCTPDTYNLTNGIGLVWRP